MSEEKAPRLIIDEDWKSQVEREKEELREKQNVTGSTAGSEKPEVVPSTGELESPAKAVANDSTDRGDTLQPPPPASLDVLLSNLATQALVAMGQLSIPGEEPFPVRLDFAKHYIDMIDVLEAKTAGNRTAEESAHFSDALHQLRLMYVATVSRK